MKKALITGITGQDGSYLTELLLEKEYEVHGMIRRSSSFNTRRIDHLYKDQHEKDVELFLHYGDMTDSTNIIRLLQEIKPDEIYNLAAQSHVKVSFETPEYTANADALGTLRILEAIKLLGFEKKTRFYQASTSELFGKAREIPQKETTPFYPRSPYGVAKLYGFWITVNYREAYNIFACNGILFNHESSRRGETFVTRKITRASTRIFAGNQKKMYLGNLSVKRDWGYTPDFVKAKWMMLQQEKPNDYVIATGEAHSVREFCEESFQLLGIILCWDGNRENERGIIDSIDKDRINEIQLNYNMQFPIQFKKGDVVIEVDSKYFRPTDVEFLIGDFTKARKSLGWKPEVTFKELVKIMTKYDLALALKEKGRKELIKE